MGTTINETMFEELCDIMEEEMPSLLQTFRDTIPELIEQTGAAIAQHDSDALAKTAHRIKGSSGNLGAERLMAVAFELEQKGRAGEAENAALLQQQLVNEYSQVSNALHNLSRKYLPS